MGKRNKKKFGTAVNAICHRFGSPWSFIYSHSMDPYKVTEPYGYRNKHTVRLYDYNVMHGLILCPMMLLLYPLWIN